MADGDVFRADRFEVYLRMKLAELISKHARQLGYSNSFSFIILPTLPKYQYKIFREDLGEDRDKNETSSQNPSRNDEANEILIIRPNNYRIELNKKMNKNKK